MKAAAMLKLMMARKKFEKNHPKVMAFLENMNAKGFPEGTILELTVTRPGEAPVTANMVVKAEDLELMEELKSLKKDEDE